MYLFLFPSKNIEWDTKYRNVPIFFIDSTEANGSNIENFGEENRINTLSKKIDWFSNNYFERDLKEMIKKNESSGFEKLDNFGTHTINIEESVYTYNLEEWKRINYLILYDRNEKIHYFYFVSDLSVVNEKIIFNYQLDYLLTYFEKIYRYLPSDIFVERSHANRYFISKETKEKSFLFNKNNLKIEKISVNSNLNTKKNYSLKIKSDEYKPCLAIYLKNNFSYSSEFDKEIFEKIKPISTANSLSLPYSVIFLPVNEFTLELENIKISNFEKYGEVLKLFSNKIISSQFIPFVNIKNLEYSIFSKGYHGLKEDLKILWAKELNHYSNVTGNGNNLLIYDNQGEVEDFWTKEFSYNSELNFLYKDPKLYQWPFKFFEVNYDKSKKMIVDPRNLISNKYYINDSVNIKINYNLTPNIIKYRISLTDQEDNLINNYLLNVEDDDNFSFNYLSTDNLIISHYKDFETVVESGYMEVCDDIGLHCVYDDYIWEDHYYFNYIYNNNGLYKNNKEKYIKNNNEMYPDPNIDNLIETPKLKDEYSHFSQENYIHNSILERRFDSFSAFNLRKGNTKGLGFNLTKHESDYNTKRIVGTYIFKYGYNINETMNKRDIFFNRQNFNYVRISNFKKYLFNIPNLNEDEIDDLNKIFGQGVRFWHQVDISKKNWLNYSVDNEETHLEEF